MENPTIIETPDNMNQELMNESENDYDEMDVEDELISKFSFPCPNRHEDLFLKNLLFYESGNIQVITFCPVCNKDYICYFNFKNGMVGAKAKTIPGYCS